MVFRKSLLASSVALALVGTYSPAYAQDDEPVIEEIIVEGGIRGSLKAVSYTHLTLPTKA